MRLGEVRRALEAQEAEAQERLGKRGGAYTLEIEVAQFGALFKRPPQRVMDVGANLGEFTAGLRQSYPEAEVLAVEPSALNVGKLRARFADDPKVQIAPCAAGSQEGQATLFANEEGSALGSLSQRDLSHLKIPMDVTEEVRLRRIDGLVAEYFGGQAPDLIKLDVEGHELDAIHGASGVLDGVAAVQFEFGGCNIDTRTYLKDFWQFFAAQEFDLYRIAPIGLLKLNGYREHMESFMASNYLAANRALLP
ncbi:FkbM family methyltransferase [Alphaproteobacteria bacterium KMM 3653]|uniref:FkbM family methyltransferase n=1 Tax=Harenicola maris TaxID=2841044 RepID=A0AAP2G449_9RHOB|nr:FkbM family methyltransferase [Harenicola maris]